MSKKVNWDRIADEQFNSMPEDYQDGWRDLIEYVNKQ